MADLYLNEGRVIVSAVYADKLEAERMSGRVTWPSQKYAADPVAFCRDILGFAPTRMQAEILEGVRDHDRTACKSGRKVGKSRTGAAAALWFFTQFDNATIVLGAPSEKQITEVIWYDLVQLWQGSGRCLECKLRDPNGPRPCPHSTPIDGELSATVRVGLRAGARRCFGLSPRNADNARGVSGPNQFWVFDESPGVNRAIYDAADGNRAAGARLLALGNPSSRSCWFFDAFETYNFHRITVSSLSSPNHVFGRKLVPGLADTPWLEEKRADWGEDDARWYVEVLGEFPTRDLVTLVTDEDVGAAFDRWEDTPETGPLVFGVDPAGGGGGDSSVIVCRRGSRVLDIRSFMGGTDTIMTELVAMLAKYRGKREPFRVAFDASSSFGRDLAVALRELKLKDEYSMMTYDPLESRGDARKDYLLRQSGCARPKDAFWLNMAQRIKTDLGIPYDEELREELIFAEWQADREGGSRLIEKKTFRARLGRSPDKADALAYCLWEGRVAPLSKAATTTPVTTTAPKVVQHRGGAFDPYAALDAFNPGRRR